MRAFAVVCHPHPLYGGTLDNKVVYTVARAFQQCGAPAIRFNYRGVGASAGSYDEGRGETQDALAVIAYGRRALAAGGAVAGRLLLRRRGGGARRRRRAPARLVLVAPAVDTHRRDGGRAAGVSVADRAGGCG